MPNTKHKKWQRPKLLVFTKSDSEAKLLEAASTTNPPCLRPENKDGRCYKGSDRILTAKAPRH
jgi:hypothetical protein